MTSSRPCNWNIPVSPLLLQDGDVHVWRAYLDVPSNHLLHFQALLSTDEMGRAERFRFPIHRNRFIARRGILRTLLGQALEYPPQEICFAYSAYGKPYLSQFPNLKLHFNLSHSEGLALIALTLERDVGIDLEQVTPSLHDDTVAEQFFHPREVALLRSLPRADQTEAFLRIWVHKEAYIKALGKGLSFPLHSFDTSQAWNTHANESYTLEDLEANKVWGLRALTPAPCYTAALAAEGNDWTSFFWDFSHPA